MEWREREGGERERIATTKATVNVRGYFVTQMTV